MDNTAAIPSESGADQVSDPIKDAEAAVAALADSFLKWITADIDKANQALAAAQGKPGDNQPEPREIFGVVHNVKGQGGSFGYDLLTKIGGSMYDYLRSETASASDKQLKAVAAHFAAMDFVLEKNIQGSGDDVGTQLIGKI